jgi:hypothetical protein
MAPHWARFRAAAVTVENVPEARAPEPHSGAGNCREAGELHNAAELLSAGEATR